MGLMVFLVRVAVIVFEVGLASYVAVRAWHTRPARMFVLATFCLIIINSLIMGRPVAITPWEQELIGDINTSMQGVFLSALVTMLAALFVPQWWRGRRPIRWILLPYVLTSALVALDLLLNLGIFTTELRTGDLRGGETAFEVTLLGQLLLGWYVIGTVVAVVILVVSFINVRSSRRVIGVLALALAITLAMLPIAGMLAIPNAIYSLLITLPLLASLAYAALSSDVLVPVRIASEMALKAMRDPVVVIGEDGLVLFCNPAAAAMGVVEQRPIAAMVAEQGIPATELHTLSQLSSAGQSAEHMLQIGEHQLEVLLSPITTQSRRRRGTLVLGRDITEAVQRSAQLEAERARLKATVQELESRERERDALSATVRSLSLPVIPILDRVLVMPLVGALDAARAEDLAAVLLPAIEREQARLVLLDITGVPLLDTAGAAALINATRAAALLGARCALVGIRPEIAQTLVSLGVALESITTTATLQQALHRELGRADAQRARG